MAAITGLPPVLVLVVVFVLPALESSTLLGVVVPGEIAVLLGGVVAHGGRLPLWAVLVVAAAGAAVGDQVGYLLGRRYGPVLLARAPERIRRSPVLDRARALIRTRGAVAVVLGRWTAVLRTVVPAVAGAGGMARMPFTVANVTGGLLWAAAVSVLGYLGAASYHYLERRLSIGGEVLFGVVAVVVALWIWRQRVATRRAAD
ncbi:DedA family protein [Polymorphospora sp. NPDC051019]|uniref:DedA family protein n=1 Tax=Polymorphospora sp. NPDC051019 TaxID=3155725 RepID=UPI0034422316